MEPGQGDARAEGSPSDGGDLTRALARGARDGDADSFRQLYERLAPALYAWAGFRVRPELRAWIDPQDLVQEVWCRAWRSIGSFDPEQGSFRYWIFRVAKNVLLEAHRKSRQPSGAGTTQRVLALQAVPDDATAITRRVARDEGTRRLAEWLAGLAEEDRELVLRCGLEGAGHAEVAERMQLGREAVTKRWQRLRQRLEEQPFPRALRLALED